MAKEFKYFGKNRDKLTRLLRDQAALTYSVHRAIGGIADDILGYPGFTLEDSLKRISQLSKQLNDIKISLQEIHKQFR